MTKSRKHCCKRRNCSFWAISSFVTMFSKSCLLQRCQKASIWGKELKTLWQILKKNNESNFTFSFNISTLYNDYSFFYADFSYFCLQNYLSKQHLWRGSSCLEPKFNIFPILSKSPNGIYWKRKIFCKRERFYLFPHATILLQTTLKHLNKNIENFFI